MFLKDSEMSKKAQVVIKEIGIIGKDIGRLAERVADVESRFNQVSVNNLEALKFLQIKFKVELKRFKS